MLDDIGPYVVNVQLVTFSLALGEGMVCNTNFSWLFLQTIQASIITNNNILISGIFGDQSNLDMMILQRAKEAPKTSEGLPVLFQVTIPETQNNMEVKGIMDSMVELNKMVIHQHQIPGHMRGAGKTP